MESETILAKGIIERIGSSKAKLVYKIPKRDETIQSQPIHEHQTAIELALKSLCHQKYGSIQDVMDIDAVGHRVVHGGDAFTGSVLINEAVFKDIQSCVRFAPLHNPPNIKGISASLYLIPFARQVAVFDTAFHQTIPEHAYIYGLPYQWYTEKKIRRYGFHGTSHHYVSKRAADIMGKSFENLKIITCHLGNGASITAIDKGKSIDTSMGFTPLEGLVMGTRCGDIDPAIPLQVMKENNLTIDQMDAILNKKSGLWGITNGDSDVRTIERKAKSGSEVHLLALKIFTYRIQKYIGAYSAIMNGLDAVVFTAGIGENSSLVRQMICEGLEFLGIQIDPSKNRNNEVCIHKGRVAILVIPTNEELAIAQEVMRVLSAET